MLAQGRGPWERARAGSAFTSWHQHLGPAAPWAAPALAGRWVLAVSQPALSVQMIKAPETILPISSMDLMPCARNELHLQLCVLV